MKRSGNIIYIVVCLLFCVLPFAGMAVYRTDTTTENKNLAAFPKWVKDGGFNWEYCDELSAYFEDHFSLRQELVSADAMIQGRIFGVSNVDTVLVGEDGWLFYTDTENDYLRKNVMTKRQAFNTVNNLALLQQYVREHGADFLFTVAPNKNSLYAEYMPYYMNYKAGDVKNMDLLSPKLAEADISYADLFEAFQKQQEVLYLKRDSHWNNKGAVLAYNTMLDCLLMEHETYENVKKVREEKEYGDLNTMLYPIGAKPEWNYYYQYENQWSYVSEDEDVEAAWIQTKCDKGEGKLLMFRDSFGNTLLPLMAEQFADAFFSKGTPYPIADYMETYQPDLVIAEKVERNLDEYMRTPPIMQGPEIQLGEISDIDGATDSSFDMSESLESINFWSISGELTEKAIVPETRIYIRLKNREKSKIYEAFTTVAEQSDYGYRLYLNKKDLQSGGLVKDGKITVDVIAEGESGYQVLDTGEVTLPEQY